MTTNVNDDFITRMLLEDIKTLSEKAKTEGVTAYLDKPKSSSQAKPKLRPNQRFLRNTIAGVEHANKRAQEDEMWSRRRAQNRLEEPLPTERSADDSADKSAKKRSYEDTFGADHAVHEPSNTLKSKAAKEEEQFQPNDDEFSLPVSAQRRVRGRGSIGPRIGLTGPYLGDESLPVGAEERDRAISRPEVGPAKPEWLETEKTSASSDDSSSNTSSSEITSEDRRRRRREKEKKRKRDKEKRDKKEKKRKKDRKKKRRKEREQKRRRKSRTRSSSHKRSKRSKDSSSSSPSTSSSLSTH